jgi:hypothetical protein
VNPAVERFLSQRLNLEPALRGVLGAGGYQLLGVAAFAALALLLYRTARSSAARAP